MYAGRSSRRRRSRSIFRAPAHPYTQGLLQLDPARSTTAASGSTRSRLRAAPAIAAGLPLRPRCPLRDRTLPPRRCRRCSPSARDHRPPAAAPPAGDRGMTGAPDVDASATSSVASTTLRRRGPRRLRAARGGAVRAVDGVSLRRRARRDAGAGRRIRLRQVHARPAAAAAHRADRRQRHVRGPDIAALSRREMRALRRTMQMIFQDPYGSLSPRRRVGDIVAEPLRRSRPRQRASASGASASPSCWTSVGLSPERMDRYPRAVLRRPAAAHRHRAGARARARASSSRDEPVSALDVSVQAQILNLLQDLQEQQRPLLPVHRPRPRASSGTSPTASR